MQKFQQTLAASVVLEGEGVFSGKTVRVWLEPAEADAGVVFVREDLPGAPRIALRPENVLGTEGATVISDGKNSVYLVEHLLSALHGLGIDNVIVRVWGPEIPLFDGSAEVFVREILACGLRLQPAAKRFVEVLRPFEVRNGVGRVLFRPADELRISVRIAFDHPLIGEQELSLRVNPLSYQKEVAFARTFGFKEDLLRRREKGLLRGGSLENALVLDDKGVINGKLRARDEFVRHKALDLLGDLFVAGWALRGEIQAELSGHRLHIEAVKSLLSAPQAVRFSDGLPALALFFLAQPRNRAVRPRC
ncbi:UDP-3-O-acyl-N-acetylglucosamine deacetylase [Thermosulfurimonas sp. F29]|uniref:UDP-3-O-acyl-N-acetylglucosamine deacetylase n=1 Tax=Thermosulfurimonas sp. F29 TaxID=2867247 RepID=UPI001C82D743|nr:UDP-3-O-acyl-N-acetylglucosamine deacetylase [Thermosulfurimonas sp. F29]MBX6422517.1 UDP-3-O-acyl-N-acetylglucosamine deacetylase [Thermosulfurimonas sp. F29]